MSARLYCFRNIARRAAAYVCAIVLGFYMHTPVCSQGVVWLHDVRNLPEHRLRGESAARQDLKSGALKFYLPVCTFPAAGQQGIRRFEIQKTRYRASGIIVMADLCNDLILESARQAAFVAGYNAVMDTAIADKLGPAWKETLEQQVRSQHRKHPLGRLQREDIGFDTPY